MAEVKQAWFIRVSDPGGGVPGIFDIDYPHDINEATHKIIYSLTTAKNQQLDWEFRYHRSDYRPGQGIVTALRIPHNMIDLIDWVDIIMNIRFIIDNFGLKE